MKFRGGYRVRHETQRKAKACRPKRCEYKDEDNSTNTLNDNTKVKLATLVEGDLKAPFLIGTTPRCRKERYSNTWIATLYPRYAPYNAEC